MPPDTDRGLLDLRLQLEAHDAELVVHAGFVGVRGRSVGALPAEVWKLVDTHESILARMVRAARRRADAPHRR
jgi:hypothetical protein